MNDPVNLSPDEALDRLLQGNRRFARERAEHPNQDTSRRAEIEDGQRPFAVILTCSDSRVSPTLLFDQGLGDLFVIRVAGNIHDDAVIGSIEYAVLHLDVRLVMVLGHSFCGAVTATLEEESGGHLESLASVIRPSVEKARGMPGDLLENAIHENARNVAAILAADPPILCEETAGGKVRVLAAHYDLASGLVEVI
jgi:carbonic anhydrase